MGSNAVNEPSTSPERTFTYTTQVLSQFSGVNLDAWTVNCAQLIVADLELAASSQRHYNNALNNLPVYPTPDEKLQFGWSSSHLMRNAAVHVHGYQHLMLCSALGEAFTEDYAAAVWSQLGKQLEDQLGVPPHVHQYKALVQMVNGILATQEFGLILDERIRLNPYSDSYHHASASNSLPPPAQIANAIRTMADVSNGVLQDATLVGGDVMGWFAAAAEYLVGLAVSILDKDGKELYSTPNDQAPQLKIIYVPQTVQNVENSLSSSFANTLRLTSTASHRQSSMSSLPFTGRVPWQSLLPKVFGPSFYKLDHTESKTLGNALGGIARALERLATSPNPDEDPDAISTENRSNPASWGQGLVETISTWFPDLRRLQARMERALRLSFDEANTLCVDSITQLEKLCGCDICSTTPKSSSEQLPLPAHENRHSTTKTRGPATGFCLPVILETIIALALALSRITVTASLFPPRAGILAIYHSQVQKRVLTCSLSLPSFSSDRYKILFGDEWNAISARRLRNAVAIFSGSLIDQVDVPDNLVALRHKGICAYVLRLQEEESSSKQGQGGDVIRVVSGAIAVGSKVFARMCLGKPAGMDEDMVELEGWEEVRVGHLQKGNNGVWCR